MPYTPRNSKKKRPAEQKAGDSFYKTHRWRRVSELFRIENPICEVSDQMGYPVAAELVDHIISIKQGGSEWDDRNYMPMCHKVHNVKRAMESRGLTLRTVQTENGLIPADRQEIINKMKKAMSRKKINVDGSRSI